MNFEWGDSALAAKLWQKAQEPGPELAAGSALMGGDITLRDGRAQRPSDLVCRALVYQARRLIASGVRGIPALVLDLSRVRGYTPLVYWGCVIPTERQPIDPEKELSWSL